MRYKVKFFLFVFLIKCGTTESDKNQNHGVSIYTKNQTSGKPEHLSIEQKKKLNSNFINNLERLVNFFKNELDEDKQKNLSVKFKQLTRSFKQNFSKKTNVKRKNTKKILSLFLKNLKKNEDKINTIKLNSYKSYEEYLDNLTEGKNSKTKWEKIIDNEVKPVFNNIFDALCKTLKNSSEIDLDINAKKNIDTNISQSKSFLNLCLEATKKQKVKDKMLEDMSIPKNNKFKHLINFINNKVKTLVIIPIEKVEKKLHLNKNISDEKKNQIKLSRKRIVSKYKKYAVAVKNFLNIDPKGEMLMTVTKSSIKKEVFPFEINQGIFTILLLIIEIKNSFGIHVYDLDELKFENSSFTKNIGNIKVEFLKNYDNNKWKNSFNAFSQYANAMKMLNKLKSQIKKVKAKLNFFKSKRDKDFFSTILNLAEKEYDLALTIILELQKNKILAIDFLKYKTESSPSIQ